ncbi:MAG: alpha-mannosidase [Chloroflexota bacterium]|nr:alpha-mannosidase [Chloroflexota bacterium]
MHRVRWTLEKISARLEFLSKAAIYRQTQALASFKFRAGSQPLVGIDVDDSDWEVIEPGSYWGELRQEFTLRTSFAAPPDWEEPVALSLPLGLSKSLEALAFLYGPEALAYLDGEAYRGVDANHQELPLPYHMLDGEEHQLALHGWTGIKDERYEMGLPRLVRIDQPTRDFLTAAGAAIEVAKHLPENNPVRVNLINVLDAAFMLLDLREPLGGPFYESVHAAHRALKEGIAKAGPPMDVVVSGIGHAHLDVAWLWTLRQTRQKAARTFSTALRLMEQYPDFIFTQSQPQLYQYIADDYPEMMAQIKERVAEGRWETIGGMWVEADCNITGAEALARQFLLGRRYFLETFGARESPILWLPDVFGYAWQLPQLIQQAGLSYFVTAKLSWNQYNRMPYDQFWWQGLDGSRILTYFITTSKPGWWGATYSADLSVEEIFATWDASQQKELSKEFMIAYGHGDGGGGPTRAMLDSSREMAGHPGLPRLRLSSAIDFMRRLERQSGDKLPTWNGELYLELHRGTYTSQARNKRANRKCEFLLHDAEFLAAWASAQGHFAYPHEEICRAWELLCLNQFHDIIPGSSIKQVYVDSMRDYAEIRRIGERIREAALIALDAFLPSETALAIYNPTSFSRSEVLEVSGDWLRDETVVAAMDGAALSAQRTKDGLLVKCPLVPPYGVLALRLSAGELPAAENQLYVGDIMGAPKDEDASADGAMVMENPFLRVEFDQAGDIVRLFDKRAKREVLVPGQRANQWQVFEDRPLDWEAWDIDVFYDEKMWLADPANSFEVLEKGPLRACLEIKRRVFNSDITQRVYMLADSPRIDFDTGINWQERRLLLKVAFPVDILSPRATYDIQWGNVERPTHSNTSWDWARFESCAHKWIDLSEGDYGVSLLNDCKYGYDIAGQVMRLTALKGAMFPDPEADLGEHRFTYSLLPHRGDWRNGAVPAAYSLNNPLIVHYVQGKPQGASEADRQSLVHVDAPQIIIETVKRAEDGDGLILRLYEHERTQQVFDLAAGFPLAEAYRCNLLEENDACLDVTEGKVTLLAQPYQIMTLRLKLATGQPSANQEAAGA